MYSHFDLKSMINMFEASIAANIHETIGIHFELQPGPQHWHGWKQMLGLAAS